MRYITKKKKIPTGTSRITERFLWFPKNLHGEWRWLERARWEQTYTRMEGYNYWDDEYWID